MSTDIYQCVEDIDDDNPFMSKVLDKGQFAIAKNIVFDKGEKYAAIFSEREIAVLNLDAPRDKVNYTKISDTYSSIEDLIINSNIPTDTSDYCSLIACKQSNRNMIDLFDINEQEENKEIRTINYFTDGD